MTAGTGETGAEEALADTSVFVAVEQERPLSGPPTQACRRISDHGR
jgi:hypothetical protein